tara:strand:+ start:4755 stop:5093 length:339 start_codon:yes stop_codon:yes gene_type:complete
MNKYYLKILVPLLYFNSYAFNIVLRDQILLRQNNICGKCKTPFSKMVPHEIHHLNHNKTDNHPANLLALCSNCHSAHHRFGVQVGPVYPYHEYDTDDKIYYERFYKFKNSLD